MTDWPEIIEGMASDGEVPRILVCGGRKYSDKDKVWRTLDRLVSTTEQNPLGHPCIIIHGGAKGADRLADDWAVCSWKPIMEYKADWERYGKAAGQVRNRKMLSEGKPTLVVAFPGGRGTAHMVEIAKEAGIPVIEVE